MLDKNEVRMGRCALQTMVQKLLLEGGFQQIILGARADAMHARCLLH